MPGLSLPHRESICTHPALHDALNDPKNGDFACKHLKQQASIVGNMASLDLLGSRRCVVEFGAGRGKLSHWIRTALQEAQDVHFLLVERSTTRFKVDGKNKGRDCTFERMQVDIQHLDLSKVPLLQEKRLPVVGVGKHLCGSATDLALRCLLERSSWSEDKDEEDSKDDVDDELPLRKTERGEGQAVADGGVIGVQGSPWQPLVIGVSIALCCHHRCDWRHYVGQSFFQGQGLGAAEFQAFQRMSSWATCGMSRASHHHQGAAESRANHSHQGVTESSGGTERPHAPEEEEQEGESVPDSLSSMSVQERELIGRLCKRLIDEGRLCYLRGRGLEAELSCYTRTDISMENVLLTAVTRSGHTGATHAP